MHVISRKAITVHNAENRRTDADVAEKHLLAWYREAKAASWESWSDIKQKYKTASILQDGRVVFNICGNKYRIVVKINYKAKRVYIRFVGTHEEYDKINAQEI
jgi:mRNA interferase HigB